MEKSLAEKLLDKYGGPDRSSGKVMNALQDIAEIILSDKQLDNFFTALNKDFDECHESDFMLLNGQFFDWKEFSYKQIEMINAFLSYFPPEKITDIENYIK